MNKERERCPCCNRFYPASKNTGIPKKENETVHLFKSGVEISEIALRLEKTEYAVRAYLRYQGFKLERKAYKKNALILEKNNVAIALYKQGKTLESIGNEVGLSRERVRQIMKQYNIDNGGLAIRKLLKSQDAHLENESKKAKREKRIFDAYNISVDLYKKICSEFGSPSNQKSPLFKYSRHKANSKKRGIPFQITFADWWKVWEESGKWNERGRGHGYVMARYGDTGGYEIDNVYICTSSQNAADQYHSGKVRKVPQKNLDGKCKRGHEFDKIVVKENGTTYRTCTICQAMRAKMYHEQQKIKSTEIRKAGE